MPRSTKRVPSSASGFAGQAHGVLKDPGVFLRAVPMQARARQSVEHILATAAHLLDEVGLDGFNTNLLAERAGVRVRTVYRYFPDKYAVIMALASRMMAQWDGWMETVLRKLSDPAQDWEAQQRKVIALLLKSNRQPGGMSVLRAIAAIPQLVELDGVLLDRMARRMTAALKQRGVKLAPARLNSVCKVTLMSGNAGVETYFRLEESQRAQFLSELVTMQIAYLRQYLRD
jgi:AcrR family transcriptional regulator